MMPMNRSLALFLAVFCLPLAAHAQFKLPTGYDFSKLPPMGSGKPDPNAFRGDIPLRVFEVPPDVRAFVGKEETCANYILNRRNFKDNPAVMKDLDGSFTTIQCDQLPCERNLILDKHRSEPDILKFIYTYTDGSVPNWTPGGTGQYYADNLCKVPLDPNQPMPINPYSTDYVKRTTPKDGEKIDDELDITAAQLNEVLNRIEKLPPESVTDDIVNKIVQDVKAGRDSKLPTAPVEEPAQPGVPKNDGGANGPAAPAPAPAPAAPTN
ncbi:MAG: hypothetical protein EB060_00150 [Proteobacteria bacterium]|nr:hypothetical protein [Pseudomonadota bacterium]